MVDTLPGSLIHDGALAQLGERLHGMQEVSGSIPLGSTNISKRYVIYNVAFFYGAPGMARSALTGAVPGGGTSG